MALPKKIDGEIVQAAVALLSNHMPAFGISDPACKEFASPHSLVWSMDHAPEEVSEPLRAACVSAATLLKLAFDQQVQLCQPSTPTPPER